MALGHRVFPIEGGGNTSVVLKDIGDNWAKEAMKLTLIVFDDADNACLLSYLAQNVNRVVSVDALFQFTWGTESLEDTRTVAVHISNSRKKIEADSVMCR
ncbi:winged helix-turn-helix domain-containing protein [Cohnella abietis]